MVGQVGADSDTDAHHVHPRQPVGQHRVWRFARRSRHLVLSPDHQGFDPFNGGRITLGGWLDRENLYGVEVSGFLTESRSVVNSTFSSLTGSPSLRVPFINTPPGDGFPLGASSFVLADPGFANGGQSLVSSLQLWGFDAHALFRMFNTDHLSVSLVGGFKYLELKEDLTLLDRETLIAANGFGTYVGADGFGTRNQFYGGTLGVKAEMQFGRFYA